MEVLKAKVRDLESSGGGGGGRPPVAPAAAAPPRAHAASAGHRVAHSSFRRTGAIVEANYKGKGKWYLGRISRVYPNGTYDVMYDDGDSEFAVPDAHVRVPGLTWIVDKGVVRRTCGACGLQVGASDISCPRCCGGGGEYLSDAAIGRFGYVPAGMSEEDQIAAAIAASTRVERLQKERALLARVQGAIEAIETSHAAGRMYGGGDGGDFSGIAHFAGLVRLVADAMMPPSALRARWMNELLGCPSPDQWDPCSRFHDDPQAAEEALLKGLRAVRVPLEANVAGLAAIVPPGVPSPGRGGAEYSTEAAQLAAAMAASIRYPSTHTLRRESTEEEQLAAAIAASLEDA